MTKRQQAAKIKRFTERAEVNYGAMMAGILLGQVELAGRCAEMLAHYSRRVEAIKTLAR